MSAETCWVALSWVDDGSWTLTEAPIYPLGEIVLPDAWTKSMP